jgi:hypothetical protein
MRAVVLYEKRKTTHEPNASMVTTWNPLSAEAQERICETQWKCADCTTPLWDLLVFVDATERNFGEKSGFTLSPLVCAHGFHLQGRITFFVTLEWRFCKRQLDRPVYCRIRQGKSNHHTQLACPNANRIILHGFALNVVWPELCWFGRVLFRWPTTSMSLPLAVWFLISLSFSWRDWGHKFWAVLHLVA